MQSKLLKRRLKIETYDFDLTVEERIKFTKIFIKIKKGRIKDIEGYIEMLEHGLKTLQDLQDKERIK